MYTKFEIYISAEATRRSGSVRAERRAPLFSSQNDGAARIIARRIQYV